MRTSELRKFFAFSHSLSAISLNILLVLRYFVGTNDMFIGFTCTNKMSKCTDKTPKEHYGGGGGGAGYASEIITSPFSISKHLHVLSSTESTLSPSVKRNLALQSDVY